MGKEWTTIETVNSVYKAETKTEKTHKIKNFNKLIDNTKSLKLEDLKKHGDNLYTTQKNAENDLLQAYNDKKLKSKKLIKQALRIKKERDKIKNAKQNTRKVSDGKAKGSITEATETPA